VCVQVDRVWAHPVASPRLPVSWLSDEEKAAELQRVQQRRARDAAYEAELIMALAGERPAGADPQPGSPGARTPGWAIDEGHGGVSEFFTAELSAVLNLGRGTAAYRYRRAHTWITKLPATFAALEAGELDERRATKLAEVLEHTSSDVAGQVEDALLPEPPTCQWPGSERAPPRTCSGWTPPQPTSGAPRLSGPPTCTCTPLRPTADPRRPRTCPPTRAPSASMWSTSSPRCSRPTVTVVPSARCARTCSRC
jgi:hypothetical protein